MHFLVIRVFVFTFFSRIHPWGTSSVCLWLTAIKHTVFVEAMLSFDMNENCFCLSDHSLICSFFGSTSINHNCYIFALFSCAFCSLHVQVLYQKPESLKGP